MVDGLGRIGPKLIGMLDFFITGEALVFEGSGLYEVRQKPCDSPALFAATKFEELIFGTVVKQVKQQLVAIPSEIICWW